MTQFLDRLEVWLPPLLAGALLTHLWARFRARMTVLKFQIHHLYLASAQNSPVFGDLKVLLNEQEYHNLYLSTVTFANDSARDLRDMEVNVFATPQTQVLGAYAKTSASLNYLPHSDGFNIQLQKAIGGDDQALAYVRTRGDFKVQVLNRGDSVLITLLTTNNAGLQPFLQVGCDHFGVRLKAAPAGDMFLGEPRDKTALLGLAIVFLLCWPLIQFVPSVTVAVLVAAFLGAVCLVPGVAARKVFKWMVRIGS